MSDRTGFLAWVPRTALVFAWVTVTGMSAGQAARRWTERENSGYKGLVRSVQTTVTRPNADPRPGTRHTLHVEGHTNWQAFNLAGRSVEFVSSSNGEKILAISKCTLETDGARLCADSEGNKREERQQTSVLPDGSREVKHFLNSQMESREVSQFDEAGKRVSLRIYRSNGRLSSEELTLHGGDRWKVYDDAGVVLIDMLTHESDDESIERWFYDAEGQPVAKLAISKEGNLLSSWYLTGYKFRGSNSDSLGTCQPGLCVDYKFDEKASGRIEKVVEHTHEEGNLEPDREEHYNLDGVLDEKAQIKYIRDEHGNWTSRSVLVWDLNSDMPVEIERDTRSFAYFD